MRAHFIGVWRLVQCKRTSSAGAVDYPYGENPVGRITYDQAGRMSAQLMRPGRRSTMASGIHLINGKADADEIREAITGYTAYFGTFDVEEDTTTVIHHVEAALVPGWVGTDLRRAYRFEGNRLILTAVVGGVAELTWEREE